jgi:hypothetical protein
MHIPTHKATPTQPIPATKIHPWLAKHTSGWGTCVAADPACSRSPRQRIELCKQQKHSQLQNLTRHFRNRTPPTCTQSRGHSATMLDSCTPCHETKHAADTCHLYRRVSLEALGPSYPTSIMTVHSTREICACGRQAQAVLQQCPARMHAPHKAPNTACCMQHSTCHTHTQAYYQTLGHAITCLVILTCLTM